MDFKRILVPVDFLEGSKNAIQYAVDLARKYGAKLYLLHVIRDLEPATGWYVPHTAIDEFYKDIESGAKKELDKIYAEELRGFKDVDQRIMRGTPYEEIIRFAAENEIDLIVMGTHGRKGLDRALFGSTAEHVVKRAKSPVLTVRI